MSGAVAASRISWPEPPGDADGAALRTYYREHDYLTSPAGIMKVISVVACMVSAALLLGGGSCGGAPALVAGSAALALGCAAALACLYAAAALSLRACAPVGCLFTELVGSAVIGILLLVTAVLSMTFCDMTRAIDYVHGPLALVTAGVVTGSAVATYASVMRHWDAARGLAGEPRAPPPTELEV